MHGHVAAGFEPVAEAFARNLAERGELGAAFAAVLDGEPVVDLWGGSADRARAVPWERDTPILLFSGAKGLVALCLLMLVERGALELDAPVARWWPEFAAAGKGAVTVREAATHRARLPGIRVPVSEQEVVDPVRMAALLADQPAEADPRAAFAYHNLAFGWILGELIRRADGRSVRDFFAEEVAGQLGLELGFGADAEREPAVAQLEYAPGWGAAFGAGPDDDPLRTAIYGNPPLLAAGEVRWNRPALRRALIPAANAIGTPRSMARLYGCLARGGELDGVRLLSPETLALGRAEQVRGTDAFLGAPFVFGVGFQLQNDLRWLGPPADAFGHPGAGGSVHAAWPSARVGVSYATTQLRDDAPLDARPSSLLAALDAAIAARA